MTTSLPPIDPGWALIIGTIIRAIIDAIAQVLVAHLTRARTKSSRRRGRIKRWVLRTLRRLFQWLARQCR